MPPKPVPRDKSLPLRLKDIPINDPKAERRTLEEKGQTGYMQYLFGPGGSPYFQGAELAERISEVYRQCFLAHSKEPLTRSWGKMRFDVLSDFVAHFPGLVFRSSWIAELIRWFGQRKEPLQALATGFRRAARRNLERTPDARYGQVQAAKIARSDIQKELQDFLRSLDARVMKREKATDRLRSDIAKKVGELVSQHPLLKPIQARIRTALEQNRAHEASKLIVTKLFDISVRQLERS